MNRSTRIRTASTAALLVAGLALGVAPAQAAPDVDGWRVLDARQGSSATWTSPTPLPVTSARPEVLLDGEPLGPVVLSGDGYSLTVPVPSGTRPADLDVVLSGVRLDEPGSRRPATGGEDRTPLPDGLSRRAPGVPDLGVDPGRRGPHAVQSSDYDLGTLPFEGFEAPIEVTGHVVAPAAAEQVTGRPLVLFLHGRHQPCYGERDADVVSDAPWPCAPGEKPVPSDLGYDYVQRLLASQGFTTVSIAANGINAQDFDAADGGALARSALVRRHLDAWADGDVAAARGVDLDRVVLVGHSRGGEGVDLAAQQVPRDAGYRIAGEVLLGPVDFARRTAAYVPTVTVLPYCDGDVSDLQGQLFTDTSRGLAPGDTALKSTVLVMGANHNFFNTEWTPRISKAPSQDDWFGGDAVCGAKAAGRLSPAQQRAVGAAYVAGAVATFTHQGAGTAPELAMYDGTPGRVASAGPAVVYSHAVGGGRSLVLPETVTPSGTGTAVARTCEGLAGIGLRTACGRGVDSSRAPHWAPSDPEGLPTRSAVEVSWRKAGAVGRLELARPWDLTGAASLDLRAVAAPSVGSATVAVRLEDATGASATLRPTNGGVVRALPGRATFGLAKLVAQQLRVPLGGVEGVDLSRVTAVSLVARSATGTVWVLDLAGTPDGLAAVPDRRLPTISLDDAEVTETGSGKQVAEVPWTLSAPLEEPARLAVVSGDVDGTSTTKVVEVPAGRRSGSFEVGYTADDAWTPPRVGQVAVFPVSGLAVADGIGTVEVVDDEPAPVAVVSVPAPVREGSAVRVTVSIDKPVGVDLGVQASFLRPPNAPRVSAADLPARWVSQYVYAPERRSPLWDSYLDLYAQIPAGQTSTTLVIPTRADKLREGDENLLLDVVAPQLDLSSEVPVVVQDR